jgi:hypothetical protein
VKINNALVIKVDLDIDSDNNNRYNNPDFSDKEDEIEENNPGKIIFNNVDSDGGKIDRDDNTINGAKDKKDMAKMRLILDKDMLEKKYEAVLTVSDKTNVRVFRSSGEVLVGPEPMKNKVTLKKEWFDSNGKLDMFVEGVNPTSSSVIISVYLEDIKTKQKIPGDTVKVRITNTLAMGFNKIPPFRFINIMQRRDTNRECLKCKTQNLKDHPFDHFHIAYAQNCRHCNTYCTRASVAMINWAYGGFLSQDRISIYGYDQKMWTNPNNKLGHGIGLFWKLRKINLLAWALTLNKTAIMEYKASKWHDIANTLVTNRPVGIVWMAGNGILYQHSSVICGVKVNEYGIKMIQLADPTLRKIDWYAYQSFKRRIKALYVIKDDSVKSIKAIKKQ